jgi:hypothetical protein
MANYTPKRKYTKKTAATAPKTVKLGKKVLPVVVPAKKTLTEKVISWLKNLI